jgi:signal transduction histidine kinase
MKLEAKGIGRTLKISLEKISLPREMEYVQDLIDSVEEYERTLGVIVYHHGKDLIFRSQSIQEEFEPFLKVIENSIREDRPKEEFGFYKEVPVFLYTFPIKDGQGKNIGGVAVFQQTTIVEEDIKKTEWSIFITTLLLISGTVTLIFFTTRRWVTNPLFQLEDGIKNMAKGNLSTKIDLKSGSEEISKVAKAFNLMAVDLKEAQDQIIQEAETTLELERSLRHSEKLAIIGKLASELAHEIRTPLTSIKIFIQSLEKEIDIDENREEDFRIIKKEIDRINENITRLLNFARPEEPQFQQINVHELVKDTLNLLMAKVKNNKIQLDLSLLDTLPPLDGDPKQLGQVLLNLLLNAIEAMPQGGTLTIRSSIETNPESPEKFLQLVIQDTGRGIREGDKPFLFDPFFTTKEEGTGLGLSVVYSLVQKHHGQIEVKSEWGSGSSFILTLPIRKESSWEELSSSTTI